MTLSQKGLQRALSHPFQYFDRVDSSNDVAKRWLLHGAPELATVIADEQIRGRGRGNRRWHTPPNGGLAVSVILRPPPALLPRINMLGALSVYDLALTIGCRDLGIKWPNDVLLNGRKLSGILSEPIWLGDELAGAVLGIGVNVRNNFAGSALEGLATCLEDATLRRLDRTDLIRQLLGRVERWYADIDSDSVFEAWRARLSMLDACVSAGGKRGIATDVAPDGALLLRDAAGDVHKVDAADIHIDAPSGVS